MRLKYALRVPGRRLGFTTLADLAGDDADERQIGLLMAGITDKAQAA